MEKYVLANADNETWRGTRIVPGQRVHSPLSTNDLVTRNQPELGESPLVAVMLNPWHAHLEAPKMLELQLTHVAVDAGEPGVNLRVRETEVPPVTTDQKIIFSLMALKELYGNEAFCNWADGWISGRDRSAESAGRMFACLGKIIQEVRTRNEIESAADAGIDGSLKTDGEVSDFCTRVSEAIFAAQIYVDRPENWPLLAARSVSRAVSGLGASVDLSSIADRAIEASSKGVMRSCNPV